eukprot:14191885-Alexandrium_andersonii.AAC.1
MLEVASVVSRNSGRLPWYFQAHPASSWGGPPPPGPPRKAPLACPPACFLVTIGFSEQNDAEPLGRVLG